MKLRNSLLAIVISILTLSNLVAQEKPNVVIVFMDNFGWGEPGFNGGGITRGAKTPQLDILKRRLLHPSDSETDANVSPIKRWNIDQLDESEYGGAYNDDK